MPSLNPYLSFKNQTRSAMDFYQGVFGGDLTVSTFGDFPGMTQDPAENDLVMHSQLTDARRLRAHGLGHADGHDLLRAGRHLGVGERR